MSVKEDGSEADFAEISFPQLEVKFIIKESVFSIRNILKGNSPIIIIFAIVKALVCER